LYLQIHEPMSGFGSKDGVIGRRLVDS
jgi:hypothetical protein